MLSHKANKRIVALQLDNEVRRCVPELGWVHDGECRCAVGVMLDGVAALRVARNHLRLLRVELQSLEVAHVYALEEALVESSVVYLLLLEETALEQALLAEFEATT